MRKICLWMDVFKKISYSRESDCDGRKKTGKGSQSQRSLLSLLSPLSLSQAPISPDLPANSITLLAAAAA